MWCWLNLQLNTGKILIRICGRSTCIFIQGVDVDTIQDHKYLGPEYLEYLDNMLDWTKNTEAVYKKGQRYYIYALLTTLLCNCCTTISIGIHKVLTYGYIIS